MSRESVPSPGVVERVEVDAGVPEPSDCLPPSEAPLTTVELSPGWVAVTDRELLSYHPDREPNVTRVLRANVTGLALRRAARRELLGYVPMAALAALGSVGGGLLLLSVDATTLLPVPAGTSLDTVDSLVQAVARATTLLGSVLVFLGVLVAFAAVAVVARWLLSKEVALAVERGGAEPVECPATRPAARRALRSLRPHFADDGTGLEAERGSERAPFEVQ